ncbi:superoxide dismutase family protein [Winogradskyella vidalii]|uniref:superoxide dismutase family protein n=1 Tax=Winogradskyella vidalii TaxID=2615024 RepID=UPI0015C8C14E|nr:superoxide dismutase family protein [Winogradskyella vidalii]
MNKLRLIVICFTVVFATACKDSNKEKEAPATVVETEPVMTEDMTPNEKKLTVTLAPKNGSNVEGSINFSESDNMVTMVGTITGLEEGKHAIHIHEKADCSADDGTSSGGHWNPTGQPHGAWGDEAGYHKGDIGNLVADANGRATISKMTDEWCIGCEDETKDVLGKAIIVHIGEDDLVTQPTGAAGARIGCAGIIE